MGGAAGGGLKTWARKMSENVRSFVALGETMRHYEDERIPYEKSFICLICLWCGWSLAGG
jgi:hypothetical protein